MAYVTGPISTLPGHHSKSPDGEVCDHHPDRPAIHRVQGETDSFGCEGADYCQECYDKQEAEVAKHKAEAATGMCEWCKNHATDLKKHRDFEEGASGRVYDVCLACRRRESEALAAEHDDNDYY